jgi:malate dehydrogenase (oxaloacetate-decarboxylating)(NADP+)
MCEHNERPIVFPLSNPTSKAECTFEQAFEWTNGKVLFASGSPFDPITVNGVTHSPAQANNAYVFPALGHAAVIAGATSLPEEAFLLAAESLAKITSVKEVEQGHLFPHFDGILSVSKGVILEVRPHSACCRLHKYVTQWCNAPSVGETH